MIGSLNDQAWLRTPLLSGSPASNKEGAGAGKCGAAAGWV